MKFPVVHLPFLPAAGMAVFPFIFIKYNSLKKDKQIINHELIHLRQQIELLVLPFYIIYFFHYLLNILRYKNHNRAYRNIIFEKEAYDHDSDLVYLKTRKLFSWMKYINP